MLIGTTTYGVGTPYFLEDADGNLFISRTTYGDYCAVTKVLDGFCFGDIQIAGHSRGRVGLWCGILLGEFKTWRIIMHSSGTMKGPRLQEGATSLRFYGG